MPSNTPPVPAKGAQVPAAAIDQNHPEYDTMAPWYRFLRESHEGSGGYAPVVDTYSSRFTEGGKLRSYLTPHVKEDPDDYQTRVRCARPPRFMADGIAITTGVLTYQEPRRDTYPDKLVTWLNWVTPDGQPWKGLVANDIVPMLERYCWTGVLITRPPTTGRTEAEQIAERKELGLPELVASVITPEHIRNWELDESGSYVWVRCVERRYLSAGPNGGAGNTIQRHWWYSRLGWWYVDDMRGLNNLEPANASRLDTDTMDFSETIQGEVPIAKIGNRNAKPELVVGGSGYWKTDAKPLQRVPLSIWELPGRVGPSHACATSSLMHYNVESELRDLERQTNFSMLFLPSMKPNEDVGAIIKGPSRYGSIPHDSHVLPMMLTPDSGPFAHYVTRMATLEGEALAAWGLRQDLGGGGTGIALSLIQERATNLYRQHAKACSRGEYASLGVAAEMLGIELPADTRADWPTEFSSLTATNIVENVAKFLESDPGDKFEVIAITEAARAMFPHLTQDEIEEAVTAMEDRQKEKADLESEDRDLEIMGQKAAIEGSPPALDSKRARGAGGMERLDGQQG